MLHNSKIIKLLSLSLLAMSLNAMLKEPTIEIINKRKLKQPVSLELNKIKHQTKIANLPKLLEQRDTLIVINLSKIGNQTTINKLLEKLSRDFSNYRSKIIKLDLSENDLKQVPENITQFPNIKSLNLSNNDLSEYPQTYSSIFFKLERLNLKNNPSLKDKTIKIRKNQDTLVLEQDSGVIIQWDTATNPW